MDVRGLACLAALVVACGSAGLPEAPTTGAATDKPDEQAPAADQYVAAPRPNGVSGAPEATELGRAISTALAGRGDTPEPDGALAATARWFLSEVVEGRPPTSTACARSARRSGYVGRIVMAVTVDLGQPGTRGWQEAIGTLPRNLPLNRFGVHASAGARVAAVVLGAVEATLQPFPAAPPRGRHAAPPAARSRRASPRRAST